MNKWATSLASNSGKRDSNGSAKPMARLLPLGQGPLVQIVDNLQAQGCSWKCLFPLEPLLPYLHSLPPGRTLTWWEPNPRLPQLDFLSEKWEIERQVIYFVREWSRQAGQERAVGWGRGGGHRNTDDSDVDPRGRHSNCRHSMPLQPPSCQAPLSTQLFLLILPAWSYMSKDFHGVQVPAAYILTLAPACKCLLDSFT